MSRVRKCEERSWKVANSKQSVSSPWTLEPFFRQMLPLLGSKKMSLFGSLRPSDPALSRLSLDRCSGWKLAGGLGDAGELYGLGSSARF